MITNDWDIDNNFVNRCRVNYETRKRELCFTDCFNSFENRLIFIELTVYCLLENCLLLLYVTSLLEIRNIFMCVSVP